MQKAYIHTYTGRSICGQHKKNIQTHKHIFGQHKKKKMFASSNGNWNRSTHLTYTHTYTHIYTLLEREERSVYATYIYVIREREERSIYAMSRNPRVCPAQINVWC